MEVLVAMNSCVGRLARVAAFIVVLFLNSNFQEEVNMGWVSIFSSGFQVRERFKNLKISWK